VRVSGSSAPLPLPSLCVDSPGFLLVIDASGCDPERLRSVECLQGLFGETIAALGLHPMHEPLWQRFPHPGGITGFVVLSESHMSIHTFPETGYVALDLYCCKPRPDWDWSRVLARHLHAQTVGVRRLERAAAQAVLAEGHR